MMKTTPLQRWIIERTALKSSSQETLQAYQLGEIQKTLMYAKEKSRFYQRTLSDIDLHSIRTLKDFESIPFTTPEDIKQSVHDFVCVPSSDIERIVTLNTSGTTGDEKRLFFTHEDLEATIDFFQYGMNCLVDENDKVMVLLPGVAQASIGDLLKKALSRSNIECVVHGLLNDVEKSVQCIEKHKITCIVGIPMQILYLSKLKPELFYTQIKKVLLSTDYVPDALVEALSKDGACKVYNHYGMTEMGYGGGVECECLHGYHVRENHLYFEIINPITGECVSDGEYGEVVFTTFNRQAMPLIRYRTGDIARFLTKPCACGTFLRTMEKVRGRIENKVCIHGYEMHLRDFDEILLRFAPIVDYTLNVCENDVVHITCVVSNKEAYEKSEQEMIRRIREHFSFGFTLSLENVEDDYSPKITNSMIKRKLRDSRGDKR